MQTFKLLILSLFLFAHASFAHDYKLGSLVISHPYTYETPPNAPVAGGYLSISNKGQSDDKLISVKSNIANLVQIHEMSVQNDVMRMQEITGGLVIPAGETVSLESGGKHIMFMQLQKQIKADHEYAATLVFEKAGEIDIYFEASKHTGK